MRLAELAEGRATDLLLPEPASESAPAQDPSDDLVLDPALDTFGVPAGQGFEDDVAEGIGVRWEDEQVHVGVGGGEGFAAQDSGELDLGG